MLNKYELKWEKITIQKTKQWKTKKKTIKLNLTKLFHNIHINCGKEENGWLLHCQLLLLLLLLLIIIIKTKNDTC